MSDQPMILSWCPGKSVCDPCVKWRGEATSYPYECGGVTAYHTATTRYADRPAPPAPPDPVTEYSGLICTDYRGVTMGVITTAIELVDVSLGVLNESTGVRSALLWDWWDFSTGEIGGTHLCYWYQQTTWTGIVPPQTIKIADSWPGWLRAASANYYDRPNILYLKASDYNGGSGAGAGQTAPGELSWGVSIYPSSGKYQPYAWNKLVPPFFVVHDT